MLLKKQWFNREIKKKYLKTNNNKKQPFKIYEMSQKQFLKGSSQQYRPSSKKKKNLKSTT